MLTPVLVAFYKEKGKRLTGSDADYFKSIRINPAEGTFAFLFLLI